MRRAAAGFAGVPVEAVRIGRTCRACGSDRHGKPIAIGPPDVSPVHVSLSRSGRLAVVAVSDAGPVGVDLEVSREPTIPGARDLGEWVRKESVLKATGHGLLLDPDSIAVTVSALPPELLTWPGPEPIGAPIWMFDVAAPAGFIACATVLSAERPVVAPTQAAPGA